MNVVRGKSEKENCSSMSLEDSLKISALLDEWNGYYGLNGKTGLFCAICLHAIFGDETGLVCENGLL